MSDGLGRLRRYRRPAMLHLAALLMFSTVGCGSMPDVPDGAFDPIMNFGSNAKQEAFEQQVENDPFPTARRVGL